MRLPSYPEAMVAHLDGVPVVAHTDGAPRPQAARCPACMGSLTTRPRSRAPRIYWASRNANITGGRTLIADYPKRERAVVGAAERRVALGAAFLNVDGPAYGVESTTVVCEGCPT